MTIEEWRANWIELQDAHAATLEAIDNEQRWMMWCLVGAFFIVPLPFTFAMFIRAKRKVWKLQRHSEAVASRMATS